MQCLIILPDYLHVCVCFMHMRTCSVDDLRYYAERYGALRDIYIPRDYYTSERA